MSSPGNGLVTFQVRDSLPETRENCQRQRCPTRFRICSAAHAVRAPCGSSPLGLDFVELSRDARDEGVIERPAVVRQILDRLGLPLTAPSLRAPPNPSREWSYEPLFDLPVPCYGAGQTGDLPIPDPACLPADR